jgi:hypothetical protein
MKKLNRRFAILAAAALSLSAAAVDASATTIYYQSNLNDTGTDVQFVGLVDPSKHRPPLVLFQWGSAKSGFQTGSFDIPDSDSFTQYAIFGLDNSGGIFVSFSNPDAGIGDSFENLFPGLSEQGLVTDLPTDGPTVAKFAALLATMPANSTSMATQCSCTHLSVGADYGSFDASFTPIPEPTTATLIFGAAGFTLLLRRRRT